MSEEAALCEEAATGFNDDEIANVNLHSVESISDLHWTSTSLELPKGAEGSSQPSTPGTSDTRVPVSTKTLLTDESNTPSPQPSFTVMDCFQWPICGPTCCRLVLYTVLASLIIGTIALIAYTVVLSEHHSESISALSAKLASQEKSIRQLRLATSRVWQWLNASDPLGHT
ncbi:leucine-rich single-pass membrane protein 2 [Ambystoma mexicanum]|uniref:leucine-rich single-pass membrane protein 2 n=1 Tax=Ambystoma mexicanum TaxID=8296 RepID=UPI0037E9C6CD